MYKGSTRACSQESLCTLLNIVRSTWSGELRSNLPDTPGGKAYVPGGEADAPSGEAAGREPAFKCHEMSLK